MGLLISILISYLVYKLAGLFYNECVARISTIIVSVHPALALYAGIPMSDLLLSAGYLLAIYIGLSIHKSRTNLVLCGVALGCVCLVKITALMLVFVIAFSGRITTGSWQTCLSYLITLLLGMSLVLVPWSLRNQQVVGTSALSTNLGINLLIGNHHGASGGYERFPILKLPKNISENEVSVNQFFQKTAIEYILDHPLETILRLPLKIMHFFATETNGVTIYYQGDQTNTLYSKYMLYALCHIFHCILLIGFLLRIIQICHHRHRPIGLQWIPWATILSNVLIAMVFYGTDRYRLPITPWIIIESCVLLSSIIRIDEPPHWIKSTNTRQRPSQQSNRAKDTRA